MLYFPNNFMKRLSLFLSTLVFGAFIFVTPKAHAASVEWHTDRVDLTANDFAISANGNTFTGGNDLQLHSDMGTPTSTTLEATWHEQGVEMRLYMYFLVEN